MSFSNCRDDSDCAQRGPQAKTIFNIIMLLITTVIKTLFQGCCKNKFYDSNTRITSLVRADYKNQYLKYQCYRVHIVLIKRNINIIKISTYMFLNNKEYYFLYKIHARIIIVCDKID